MKNLPLIISLLFFSSSLFSQNDCGCENSRATAGTRRCNGQYEWRLQKEIGNSNWQTVQGPFFTNGNTNFFDFQMCPLELDAGIYRVWFKCTQGWFFSRKIYSNELSNYNPANATVNITLINELNNSPDYLNTFCCGETITHTVTQQSCISEWKFTIRRWGNVANSGVGPIGSTPWISGTFPQSVNINQLFSNVGFDLVPGQCYKLEAFAQGPVNGTQWSSAGKIICIECNCSNGGGED